MYENNIYSGTGTGSNTSGTYQNDGKNHINSGNGGTEGYEGNNQFGSTYQAAGMDGQYGETGMGSSFNDQQGPGGVSGNNYQYSAYDKSSSQTDNTAKGKNRRSGYFRKAMLNVSLGLFFGLFAGVGFFAVEKTSQLTAIPDSDQTLISQETGNTGSDTAATESQSGIKLTDTNSIRVVSSDVTDVVDEVMPAMVSIVNNYTTTQTTIFGQSYNQDVAASGSGIIVAESESELLIVSNHHVVADATTLEVTFIDGSKAEAQIKGTDADMDLAVIAIPLDSLTEETKNAIAIATLGDSDSLKMGEPVIAIGNALGYGQSVTNGIISALNREISMEDGTAGTFIQTNAAINPGNSGGALLNMNGEVIGINSNKIGGSVVEGMGYAIPISAAKPIIAELMLKETRSKVEDGNVGYIGITMQTLTEQFAAMYNMPQGIYVTEVAEGSPAQEAGILPGDIIVNFDGEKITSHEDLQHVLQYYSAGTTAKITVNRPQNGRYEEVQLTITLGTKPSQTP